MLRYMGPILVVDDIARCRWFYEVLLGQKVKYDFGENVTFEGDFSIHRRAEFQALLGGEAQRPITLGAHSAELTFETDEIDALCQRLQQAGADLVHAIRVQPWQQRVLRVYDPARHVVEIGEAMSAVVQRLRAQGHTAEGIAALTGMPRAFVDEALAQGARP